MGMPTADAVDLVLRMADRCRLPYALRRSDTFARAARSHRGRPPARLTYADAWNTAGEDVSAETHCAIAWDVSAADALAREVSAENAGPGRPRCTGPACARSAAWQDVSAETACEISHKA